MPYNDWPQDFPEVTSLVPYTALRHNPDPEIKELYDRAKNHEDREAAGKLINQLVINEGEEKVLEKIEAIAKKHPDAILASVHAVEGHGKNAIPKGLAEYIGEMGKLEVDDSIVQADIVSKTGSSSWHRLAHRPSFDGNVQAGRKYILVDDVFSAGGTFSELRSFIENNGGTVVNSITMANGSKSRNPQLGVTQKHVLELEKKYGVESLQQFLKEENLYAGNHKSLTDSEARTILGTPTLNEARDRIAAARQEGSRGILQEMVQRKSHALNEKETPLNKPDPFQATDKQLEVARKTGYVQGVCECVIALGNDNTTLGKKLLAEMNVNKETAKKFAHPQTYKTMEQGIFAQKQEQQIDRTIKR